MISGLRRHGIVVASLVVVAATMAAYLGMMPSFIRGAYADKALHFLFFGLLAFFWVLRWGDGRFAIGPLSPPKAVVVPLSFAALEEAAQLLSRRRNADLVDLLADFLGLVTFWWLARRLVAHGREEGR